MDFKRSKFFCFQINASEDMCYFKDENSPRSTTKHDRRNRTVSYWPYYRHSDIET